MFVCLYIYVYIYIDTHTHVYKLAIRLADYWSRAQLPNKGMNSRVSIFGEQLHASLVVAGRHKRSFTANSQSK